MMAQEVPELALWSARLLVYLSIALLFGLVPITLLVLRPAFASARRSGTVVREKLLRRTQHVVIASLVAGASGTFLMLLNNALEDASLRDISLGLGSFERVLTTNFGQWQALRFPFLTALGILLVGKIGPWLLGGATATDERAPRRWWAIWILLSGALLATVPLTGHAGGHDLRVPAIVNDFCHVAFGASWISGIVGLSYLLPGGWQGHGEKTPLAVLAPAVDRFSHVAFWSIAAVAATGTINVLLHLGGLGRLFDTGYGRTLLVKLGVVACILIFGAINHFLLRDRLTAALATEQPSKHARLLRRNVRAELILGIAVIGATSALVGSPPPG